MPRNLHSAGSLPLCLLLLFWDALNHGKCLQSPGVTTHRRFTALWSNVFCMFVDPGKALWHVVLPDPALIREILDERPWNGWPICFALLVSTFMLRVCHLAPLFVPDNLLSERIKTYKRWSSLGHSLAACSVITYSGSIYPKLTTTLTV